VNSDLALHVILALVVVVVAGRLVGRLVARIGQPPVIGEVLAGILLGPSLLGRLAPDAADYLFPMSARPALGVIAQLGVILYMFVVGLEFDPASLRKRAAPFIVVSQVSIALPFALGYGLAFALYPAFGPPGVRFVPFALFMGIAMSITAFPVLARILTDRGLSRTKLGVAALTCAAVNDVMGWCLLGVVVGVARASLASAFVSALLAVGFIAFMFVAVRPIVSRLAARNGADEDASVGAVTWTLAGMLVSAITAEYIGIHALFGAFVFGAILPSESAVARQLALHRTPVVTILFLPAFFALTGLRTEIGLVSSAAQWAVCAVIIALAIVGKFGGSLIAGRAVGLPWGFAARLGVLMNTRGLMELVVLNVGLDIGVITPTLFTMMVVMAIVTTAMSGPLLDLLGTSRAEESPAGALVVDGRRENRENPEKRAHA
jgi:Kef-type K+ transport system membrane component KefB